MTIFFASGIIFLQFLVKISQIVQKLISDKGTYRQPDDFIKLLFFLF